MGLSPEMSAERTAIDGLWLVQMKEIGDERGVIREFFRASDFEARGVEATGPWRQVNVTGSGRGAVRGLHGESMTKLVSVVAGTAFGAYLDARRTSPTFGAVVTADLRPGVSVLVPPGVCNGFQATADGVTQYLYCFDDEWRAGMDGVAVSAFDPDLDIPWPIPVDVSDPAQVSAKDAALPRLSELPD